MTADVIALSELSDEPSRSSVPGGPLYSSPRLDAVLARLPGERIRILNGLDNMGIFTVAQLLATDDDRFMRAKNLGPVSRKYIDAALAVFGLYRVGQNPPTVVRDGAALAEVQVRRLMEWLDKRLRSEISLGEREVLRDVGLVLDMQEAREERRWPFPCRARVDGDHTVRPANAGDIANGRPVPAGSTICQSCGMVWS